MSAKSEADQQIGSAFDRYGNTSYLAHAQVLDAKKETWLATDDLIAAIVANSKHPIPQVVLDHLRRRLDGQAKKPRGRKKLGAARQFRETLVPIYYKRWLGWLQRREHTQGLEGWPRIRDAEWWTGPPHERAARIVSAQLNTRCDWRHVLNIVSKARS